MQAIDEELAERAERQKVDRASGNRACIAASRAA
jgi:hypothetical protein